MNLNFNSQTGGSGSFGAELPILGELYLGDMDDACFFVGAGFSLAYLASSDSWGGATAGPIVGPQAGLGGQFNIAGRLLGARLAYTYGLNNTKDIPEDITVTTDRRSMISLGIFYLFE